MMGSEKAKLYWNEKESNGAWTYVGLVQIFLDNRPSTMKRGTFIIYLIDAVLLNFSVDFERSLFTIDADLGDFDLLEYEKHGSGGVLADAAW